MGKKTLQWHPGFQAEHYEEVGKMCDALEELFADELKRRVECGRMSFFVSLIRKKQEKGMAVDEIVDVLETDEELVRKMCHLLEEIVERLRNQNK